MKQSCFGHFIIMVRMTLKYPCEKDTKVVLAGPNRNKVEGYVISITHKISSYAALDSNGRQIQIHP